MIHVWSCFVYGWCSQEVNKDQLMTEVAKVLHELDGAVYTGCDVNTSQQDME